jgi:hypothetical protein
LALKNQRIVNHLPALGHQTLPTRRDSHYSDDY